MIADKLCMLLSTDWFFNYWSAIGLPISNETKKKIQCKCREEVVNFVGSAESYWSISFEPVRVNKTQKQLLDIFKSSETAPFVVDNLKSIIESKGQTQEDNSTWLLVSLTEIIIKSPINMPVHLDCEVSKKIAEVWAKCISNNINFGELYDVSMGEWDQYIRSLTPDIPNMLVDFVEVEMVVLNLFGLFWAEFVRYASESEKVLLLDWYESAGKTLLDIDFTAPNWMSESPGKAG